MLKKFFSLVLDKYKQFPDILKFAINGILLGLIWILFYRLFRNVDFIDYVYDKGSTYFTNFLILSCKFVLNVMGYDVEYFGKIFRIVGSSGVYLDKGCLARNLMGVFVGFIIAYPGIIKKKLWFITLGLVIINILNIIRLSSIAILTDCCPDKVEFNHHYVFKIAVFGFILILWYLWMFKINIQKTKELQ